MLTWLYSRYKCIATQLVLLFADTISHNILSIENKVSSITFSPEVPIEEKAGIVEDTFATSFYLTAYDIHSETMGKGVLRFGFHFFCE